MDAGSNPASSTIYKGSDDLRALFFACDPRATRGSGPQCCGCRLARTPGIGHFLGQRRLFSLFGLRVRAAPGLEKSTTYARRFVVNQGDRPSIERRQRSSCWRNGSVYVTIWSVSYQIKELLLADGDSPFGKWFGSLEAVAAAKVRVAVSRMEQGNLSNVEWFRGIGEYKIDWGPGLRIYLAKDGLKIIILIGGGTKKRQQQDIDQAVALWEDYKRRKASTLKGAK